MDNNLKIGISSVLTLYLQARKYNNSKHYTHFRLLMSMLQQYYDTVYTRAIPKVM